MNPSIEQARQDAIEMARFADACKAKTPKGMVFRGITFKPFKEKVDGYWSMGMRAEPVYEIDGKDCYEQKH